MTSGCGLCERELHGDRAGHQLCRGCEERARERLARMRRLHRGLSAFLAPTRRPGTVTTTTVAEAPLPVREPVLDLIAPGGIVGILEDWRAAMQRDRGWGPPAITGSIEIRVSNAARGLSLNLEWIAAEWPQAGQFAAELRDLEAAIHTLVDPPEKTYRIGPCPTFYADGTTCGAILRAATADLQAATVTCRWCSTTWTADDWTTIRATRDPAEGAAA